MEKIKHFLESDNVKDILIVIIVILVGLGSFLLGRLSKQDESSGIKIEYSNQNLNQPANVVSTDISTTNSTKNYFASNRGTKYYTIGCLAGKTIKPENRIYFDTGEEAEKAGYILSTSCN